MYAHIQAYSLIPAYTYVYFNILVYTQYRNINTSYIERCTTIYFVYHRRSGYIFKVHSISWFMMGVPGVYCLVPRAYCGVPRAYFDGSARVVYTIIHLHVIDIYLFKLLYTCVNLVYHVIYACIQYN